MNKYLMAIIVLLAIFKLLWNGSEAASINLTASQHDEHDMSKLWHTLANLQQRARRQVSPDYHISDGRYRRSAKNSGLKIEHKESNSNVAENEESATATSSITAPNAANATTNNNKFSVLILIRNALKKVTTNLPSEQVTSNALQYFQLFEHFLQQTIEQVIDEVDDDDDDNEDNATDKIDEQVEDATTILPNVQQQEQEQVVVEEIDNSIKAEPVLPIKEIMESQPMLLSVEESPMKIDNIS